LPLLNVDDIHIDRKWKHQIVGVYNYS